MVTDPFEYARRGARSTAPDDPLVADFKRERQERTAYQIKLSPPAEQVATANAVARRAGVPAPMVQANLEGYQAKEQLERTMEIFSRFGNISRWADKDPRNAQSVKDDDESLGLIGDVFEFFKVAPGAAAGALKAGTLGVAQMADDSFKALDDFNRFVTYPVRAGLSAAEKTIFGSGFFDPEASAKLANDIFDENRDQRDIIIERARYKTENFWAKNLLAGVESIPLSAAAVLTRNPEAGTALIGTLVGSGEYQKGIDAGLTGLRATQFGATQGIIEYATEKMPVGKLISDLGKGTPFAKTFINQLIREIPGEQAATLLQDMNEWGTLNPDKTVAQFISERPSAAAATLVQTVGGVGGTTALTTAADRTTKAGVKLIDKVQKSQAAKTERKFLDGLMTAAEKSKLRQRDEVSFKDLIASLAEDARIEHAYISSEPASNYLGNLPEFTQ